jgi:hypothetical protein
MSKFGALDNAIVGGHTEDEWQALVRQWKWRCFYCARPVCKDSIDPDGEITKDHQLPISRGGVDFIWNIVPACRRCNLLKGIMTVDEFKRSRPGAQRVSGKKIHICTAESKAESSTTLVGEILPPPIAASQTTNVRALLPQWQAYCTKLKDMNDGYPKDHDAEWYKQRRIQLQTQAQRIIAARSGQRALESAGQLILPIFGDGTPKIPVESEAVMTLRGMHVAESQEKKQA